MTVSQKIDAIHKNKEKCYLYITPNVIETGAHMADNYDTLELYEQMEDNTYLFAEREIVNLISTSKYFNREMQKEIQLDLVICSDDVDMLEYAKDPTSYIVSKKDKIVAVYTYMKADVLCKYADDIYGHLYLNFASLLNEFEKNDIKCSISTSTVDSKTIDFIMSYKPIIKEKNKIKSKVKSYLYIK